jgi:hypothetical protein
MGNYLMNNPNGASFVPNYFTGGGLLNGGNPFDGSAQLTLGGVQNTSGNDFAPTQNATQRWQGGNVIDEFAQATGISRARSYKYHTGRIDGRAPQAQTSGGLTPDTQWNNQFTAGKINTSQAQSTPSWRQNGGSFQVRNDDFQKMKAGGFNQTLPDPYAQI